MKWASAILIISCARFQHACQSVILVEFQSRDSKLGDNCQQKICHPLVELGVCLVHHNGGISAYTSTAFLQLNLL